jgi:hypothetical protein
MGASHGCRLVCRPHALGSPEDAPPWECCEPRVGCGRAVRFSGGHALFVLGRYYNKARSGSKWPGVTPAIHFAIPPASSMTSLARA